MHILWNNIALLPLCGDVIAATLIGIVKDISYWPNDKTLKKVLGFT